MVLSKAGREYKQAVAEYVAEMNTPKLGDARLEVTIWVYPPNKRMFDLDNRLKAILDALEDAGVYENDSQIDVLMIQRGKIVKGGSCTVLIDILGEPDTITT